MNAPRTILLVFLAMNLLVIACANADSISSNAHIKLTDGTTASSNSNDSAWVFFNKDSTALPEAFLPAPNTNAEFFGTGEFRHTSDLTVETNVESLIKQAGSESYRHTMYWQLFSEPSQTPPYWNWSWYENHTDGKRIRRAINAGQMMNLVINKVPRWANKSLPIEHPPLLTVIEEQVVLNGTTPTQLSHEFILGEKSETYDKALVVSTTANTATVSNESVGSGDGTTWKEFTLAHTAIVPGSQRVYVNGTLWQEAEFYRGSSTLDKQAYIFFPNTGKIRFGDSWNGPTLPNGAVVTASYSYYTNPYREYSGSTYNTTENLDYRIDYTNGTIRRTTNSTIASGATVKVTYYYLDTVWWQRFWQEFVNYYKDDVIYFEVWNEENLSQSWPGTIDQYAEFLRTAYTTIKATSPNAQVVLGGLGFDMDYLSGLYSRGMKNYFDVLAWHPYGWEIGPDNPNSHYNLLNNQLFSVAASNGDASKPVFLNEIGFSTNQQGGMSWDDQAMATSRVLMMLRRNPLVINASWWGVADEARIGQQENDLYFYHLGLMAYNSSGVLQQKPAYYVFKNIAATKGIIIDLAAYNASGTITQEKYDVNKIVFTSYGDDIQSVAVSYSQKNTTDWQSISSTMTTAASDKNNFEYTINFATTNMRFVQIQLTKKVNVSDYAIDEVKVYSTAGINVALNKYYALNGFTNSFSASTLNLCGNTKQDAFETCQSCPSDVTCVVAGCAAGQIDCSGQCTTPVCTTDLSCNDNNSLTADSCTNPNLCTAVCVNTYIPQIPTCTAGQLLCSNQCTTPICTADANCNDNNSSTTDTCSNANSCTAICQNTQVTTTVSTGGNTGGGGTGGGGTGGGGTITPTQIICSTNKQCNDNNPCTKDSCSEPATTSSKCVFTKMNKCRALFVNVLTVSVTGGVTKGMAFTAIVTDDLGNPVADANVTYANESKLTNSKGAVLFTAVGTDTQITAQKDDFGEASTLIRISSESSGKPATELNISLPQTIEQNRDFIITVTDEEGSPVFGALVKYGEESKTTDENGLVHFIADSNINFIFASYGNAETKATLAVSEQSLLSAIENIDLIYVIAVVVFLMLVALPFVKLEAKKSE